MKKRGLYTLALFGVISASAIAQNITGTWQGTLQIPQRPDLRTVLKISMAEDESLKAVFYSIDQNPTPLQASSATLRGSAFKMSIVAATATYEGMLSADASALNGTWSQGGPTLPLNFAKATPETAWVIPEPPPPPKPMAADVDPAFDVATIKPSKPDEGFSFIVGRAGANRLTSTGRPRSVS